MSPILQSLANGSARGYGAFVPLGAGTAYESIASASGTGSSGSITFNSIPSTYESLQIRIGGVIDSANDWIIINNINNDTGNNYVYHTLAGNGSAIAAQGNTSQNKIIMANTSNYTTSAQPFNAIIDIHDYASSTRNKTVRFFFGQDRNGSGNVTLGSGLWLNTNAITSLKIETALGGNFTTTTQFALYGIKGA